MSNVERIENPSRSRLWALSKRTLKNYRRLVVPMNEFIAMWRKFNHMEAILFTASLLYGVQHTCDACRRKVRISSVMPGGTTEVIAYGCSFHCALIEAWRKMSHAERAGRFFWTVELVVLTGTGPAYSIRQEIPAG